MDENVTLFISGDSTHKGFAKILWDSLCSFQIPGLNISAMSLILAMLLLSLAIKILFSLFSSLNVSGGVDASVGFGRKIYNKAKK